MNKNKFENLLDDGDKKNDNLENQFIDQSIDLLIEAVTKGDSETTMFMINMRSSLEVMDSNGSTPLIIAIQKGHNNIVLMILEARCNIEHQNNNGMTPLIEAVRHNNRSIISSLLLARCNINTRGSGGWTVLHHAACEKRNNIIKLLIENNAEVDSISDNGNTPFSLAIKFDNYTGAMHFFDAKCTVNYRELLRGKIKKEKKDLLLHAITCSDVRIIKFLLSINPSVQVVYMTLLTACEKNNLEMVKIIIESKYDVNYCYRGHTALIATSHENCIDVAKYLIEQKSTIDTRAANSGFTALMYASLNGHCKYVEMMLNYNANPNIKCTEGYSAALIAMHHEKDEVVELLIRTQTIKYLEQIGGRDESLLEVACVKNKLNIVELLVKKKCNVAQFNSEHMTPLMFATLENNAEIVRRLIDAGPDGTLEHLNKKNKKGYTCLMIALSKEYTKIALILIDAGCNLAVKNDQKLTALDIAVLKKNILAVRAIKRALKQKF